LHDPQSILSSNRFFFVVCNRIVYLIKSHNNSLVWVFYPALLCRQFRHARALLFKTRSPTVQIWFFTNFKSLLVHHRAGKTLYREWYRESLPEQNQLFALVFGIIRKMSIQSSTKECSRVVRISA
jgi:hypothetical protein